MKLSFFYRFFKTKLAIKIWLYLTIIVLLITLVLGVILKIYTSNRIEKIGLDNAYKNTNHAAIAFSNEYKNILDNFVVYTSDNEFHDVLLDIINSDSSSYDHDNTTIRPYLNNYSNISTLINSSILATKDNRLFYSYIFNILSSYPTFTLGYDFSETDGITIFPSTSSPFTKQPDVIALTFLLDIQDYSNMTLLADNIDNANIVLYILLDTNKVNTFLRDYYNDSTTDKYLYIVDENGNPITLNSKSDIFQLASSEYMHNTVKSAISTNTTISEVGKNYIILEDIKYSDLYLVNVIPKSILTIQFKDIDNIVLILFTILLILLPLISFSVSIFVTKPLEKLMISIKEMENNTYDTLPDIPRSDEIGELSLSIDYMYNTIQNQITKIKEDENEKFQMKMHLLSEQITPHFLYNTLECINMEIFSEHSATASSMTASLGEYLRISLAYGDNQIQLNQEIEHAKTYIDIMNYRFQNRIQFITNVSPELNNMLIIKSILQPLVENSIKHGFSIDVNNNFKFSPIIKINVYVENDNIVISVIDNGAGIDIEHTKNVMYRKNEYSEKSTHIGLNSVYNRLISVYGEVDILFSSTPFYENKIIFVIPYDVFLNTQHIPKY